MNEIARRSRLTIISAEQIDLIPHAATAYMGDPQTRIDHARKH